MNSEGFHRLEEVVVDPLFAEIDTDLRQGRHINSHEGERYEFLRDAQEYLEAFYRQYDCELRHATDGGYFYLVPNGGRLRRRRLTGAEMLVGQALAILYLDPENLRSGGLITNEHVLQWLAALVGEERLATVLSPRRRRQDERVAQENVREEVAKAVRTLAGLGFVHGVDVGHIRLCPSLLRFAEPVRGLEDRSDALARLIAKGEIVPRGDDATNDEEEGEA